MSSTWAPLLSCLLHLSCSGRHPGCDEEAVAQALDRAVEVLPHLDEVVDGMRVFCTDDTRGMCLHDVDACTVSVGSFGVEGRMAAHTRVPVLNAVAHEAVHWHQAVVDQCFDHTAECGWSYALVEEISAVAP